jgi:hypothetical protein
MDNELNETSFMDNLPEQVRDEVYKEIADHLLNEWLSTNADEGLFWHDYQIAVGSTNPIVIEAFNNHYNLTPSDENYLNA